MCIAQSFMTIAPHVPTETLHDVVRITLGVEELDYGRFSFHDGSSVEILPMQDTDDIDFTGINYWYSDTATEPMGWSTIHHELI